MARFGILLGAVLFLGAACSDSGSSSGFQGVGDDANAAQNVAASSQTTASATALALQASFSQIDSANFQQPDTPPTITFTGNATSGTAMIDFTGGVTINNATYNGSLTASFQVTASSATTIDATVDIDFSQLSVTTNAGGTVTMTGNVSVSASLNNTIATASVSGSLTQSDGNTTITVTPNVTLSLDGSTGNAQFDGNIGVDNGVLGTWNATFTALTATVQPTNRDITGGSIQLDRNTFPQISVTLNFTGLNSGNFSIAPTGITGGFML